MSQYDNNNRGAIWGNDKKQSDTHPDFKGQAEIGGVEYWVSGWKRKAGAGANSPALSFSFQPKEQQQAPAPQAQPQPVPAGFDESDIPF